MTIDAQIWTGKIFSDGWTDGSGEAYDVIAPGSGTLLDRVGAASPADLDRAAASATAAQREWAAQP